MNAIMTSRDDIVSVQQCPGDEVFAGVQHASVDGPEEEMEILVWEGNASLEWFGYC